MIRVSSKKMFHRRRALLTIAAVAISMALLVSMLSVGQGIKDVTYNEITNSKEDVVLTSHSRHAITQGHSIRDEVGDWDDVQSGLARLEDFISINISGKKRFALAEGIVPDDAWNFLPKEGKKRFNNWFETGGDPHFEGNYSGDFTHEVLISSSLAKDFGLGLADRINLSKSSNGQEYSFVIHGIFDTDFSGEGLLSDFYFISLHLSEMQTILDLDRIGNMTVDIVDSVSFYLDQDVRTDGKKVKEFIEKMESRYPLFKGAVFSKEDRLKQVEGFVDLANGFNMGIGIVAVVIGILFVACVMVISVYERTPIIGMMRAIGISKRSIFKWTFRESVTIVTVGSVIGLFPGYLIADLMGKYFALSYGLNFYLTSFSPWIALQAFILTIVIGSMVSLLPAWLATRMNVILALKHFR